MGYAFRGDPAYDVRHRVPAEDGWPLAVYEYQPKGTRTSPVPVLLVHGTNCRYRVYDNGASFGLAPYLAAHGFHVFAVDLRGRGLSGPRRPLQRAGVFVRQGWSLDDFMDKDLPRAFELVLERAHATQLDYVGHSLGGMLAFELLSRTNDARVRRVVMVAASDARGMLLPQRPPTHSVEGHALPARRRVNVGMLLAPFALTTRYTPVQLATKLGAVLLSVSPDWPMSAAFNPKNVEPIVMQRFLWHALSGISAKKFWSFGALYRRVRRGPSKYTYAHPTLLIAGTADVLVPPMRVREAAARIAHADVRVIEFGRAHGYSADYGHTDLLLGRHAEREVFGEIAQFLGQPSARHEDDERPPSDTGEVTEPA